jgi:hypothetical protein
MNEGGKLSDDQWWVHLHRSRGKTISAGISFIWGELCIARLLGHNVPNVDVWDAWTPAAGSGTSPHETEVLPDDTWLLRLQSVAGEWIVLVRTEGLAIRAEVVENCDLGPSDSNRRDWVAKTPAARAAGASSRAEGSKSPQEHSLVKADYAEVEKRVLADEKMIKRAVSDWNNRVGGVIKTVPEEWAESTGAGMNGAAWARDDSEELPSDCAVRVIPPTHAAELAEEFPWLKPLPGLMENLLETLYDKERDYKGSWQKRGGVGAFMMLARKWDRIEAAAVGQGYDLFAVLENDESDTDDDIEDLINYLLLVLARQWMQGEEGGGE